MSDHFHAPDVKELKNFIMAHENLFYLLNENSHNLKTVCIKHSFHAHV